MGRGVAGVTKRCRKLFMAAYILSQDRSDGYVDCVSNGHQCTGREECTETIRGWHPIQFFFYCSIADSDAIKEDGDPTYITTTPLLAKVIITHEEHYILGVGFTTCTATTSSTSSNGWEKEESAGREK